MGGVGAVLAEEIARAHLAGRTAGTVVLVEGVSDRRAIEALAERRRRDLVAEGVMVIPTAGVTNLGRFLDLLGPQGYDVRLAGLVDEGEVRQLGLALPRIGVDGQLDRATLEGHGFFVCVRDLEDELIRALGTDTMVELIESEGHLRRFHSFQNQPAQRHKTIDQQLWRWLGNHKIRYAPLMVETVEIDRVPAPLDGVLAFTAA